MTVFRPLCLIGAVVLAGSGSAFSLTKSKTAGVGFRHEASSVRSKTHLKIFSSLGKKTEPEPEPVVIQGVGEEGCALPSPSRINTLPKAAQGAVFAGIFTALGLGTAAFSSFLGDITLQYEWVQNWRYTWPLLGAVYAAAGVTHFTLEESYCNAYPTRGAWGLWYLPGAAKFHVQWTGVAEVLGGLGLLIGGAYDAFAPVWATSPNVLTAAGIGSDSAAALFLLTLAITPSNIFMYTHGARLPIDGPEVPVVGHAIRGVMQIVLLGLLFQMGEGTFDALFSS